MRKRHFLNEISGNPPLTFSSKGGFLKDYRIFGNTGGVGNRTKNLFDGFIEQGGITSTDGNNFSSNISCRTGYIVLEENQTYTISIPSNAGFMIRYIGFYKTNNTFSHNTANAAQTYTFTTPADTVSIRVAFKSDDDRSMTPERFEGQHIQIEKSDVSTDYEPFGYKIPVTVSSGDNAHFYVIYTDSPLYENQSISLSDTDTPISTFSGINVISAGTDIQPDHITLKGRIAAVS